MGMSKREQKTPTYILKLFVSGASPNSIKAINNVKQICEKFINVKYDLEIIDIYQDRSLAEREQLVAIPALIRKQPLPERRMIGDMSDTQKVLQGLGLNN
jgi:circadian clock protein KaiB